MTLSLTINERLTERLSSLPIVAHLNAGHFGGDSVAIYIYILSLFPHLHTPLPSFSPSLISLMVSVDVTLRVPGDIKRSRDRRGGRWSWTLKFAQKKS